MKPVGGRRGDAIGPPLGEMAEWSKAPHWKCGVLQKGTVGSNPTLSATPEGATDERVRSRRDRRVGPIAVVPPWSASALTPTNSILPEFAAHFEAGIAARVAPNSRPLEDSWATHSATASDTS